MRINTASTFPELFLEEPKSIFQHDQTKCGWELVSNVPLEGDAIIQLGPDVSGLAISESGLEVTVSENETVKKGVVYAGQLHAERFMMQHRVLPSEWTRCRLLFPGTCWRDSGGNYFAMVLLPVQYQAV
ncbi:MAG: hypothetical protein WCO23_02360 [bacterium]